jgi:hypothetical protein
MAHQVRQGEHMFGEQAFGPESEHTFAREVAGTKKVGQFIIDGGGK